MSFGDFLGRRMKKSIEKNMKQSTLNTENIQATLREIRLTLLEADVNIDVVNTFTQQLATKVEGGYIEEGLQAHQQMVKLVHEELITILGGTEAPLSLNSHLTTMMLAGLQGSGKTTSANKLAVWLKDKKSKRPLLVALDIYRPGAIDQLVALGNANNIPVFEKGLQNPLTTAKQALEYAESGGYDVVIFDTAGRLQIDQKLMQELQDLKKIIHPQEILLVVDAMTGQDIINVTQEFNRLLKLSGVIITKLDGDARGGATLSIRQVTKLPIKFIGEGESVRALAPFYPKRMADRLLGMGDIETLFERAMDNIDERSIQKTMKRMFLGQYDLEDLRNQLAQVSKMGNLGGLLKLIPGANGKISDNQITEAQRRLVVFSILMDSMTLRERRDPRLLKALTRKRRIINGSGRNEKEFNELVTNFERGRKQVLELTKKAKNGQLPTFGGMKGRGFGLF